MTRAVVASVDVPRAERAGTVPSVALLGFDGGVHLAEPVDASHEALVDLLQAAVRPGADVLVDLPLSGTAGPVDDALARAGLPPRSCEETDLERGKAVADAVRSHLEDAHLFESNPWAVLRVLWALRAKRRLARIGEPAGKPLLSGSLEDVEPPALQDPSTPPASDEGLKRVAKTIEDALATIGLPVALEAAASTEDEAEVIRVTGRCRSLLGLLVGSMRRRRSGHVVTLDEVDPPLLLLAEPFLAGCLAGEEA